MSAVNREKAFAAAIDLLLALGVEPGDVTSIHFTPNTVEVTGRKGEFTTETVTHCVTLPTGVRRAIIAERELASK